MGARSRQQIRWKDAIIRRTLWKWIDWFFPPRCAACQQLGRRICDACIRNIRWIRFPFCPSCGTPIGKIPQHTCIPEGSPVRIRSAAWFQGPMRNLLHGLKYRCDRSLADTIVDLARTSWDVDFSKIDAILPVPLGRQRERERGYNQAWMLARSLAEIEGIPLEGKCLSRVTETRSQVGLSLKDRRQNMAGAFQANPCKGWRVVLMDDVCTTGSTLVSSAAALRLSGAESVLAITVARAVLAENSKPSSELSSQA